MFRKFEMHRSLIALIMLSCMAAAVLSTACGSGSKPLFSDLEINHNMQVQKFSGSNNSVAIVSGTAVNKGKETIEVVSLVVTFLDSSGKTIDQSSAITSNLAPGGIWNFTIQSTGPDAWKIVKYNLTQSTTR
jgi:hypothetical protein